MAISSHSATSAPTDRSTFAFDGLSITYQLRINSLDIGQAVYQIHCHESRCRIYNQASPSGLAKILFNYEILESSEFELNTQGHWFNKIYQYQTRPDNLKNYVINTKLTNSFDSLNLPFALAHFMKQHQKLPDMPIRLQTRKETNEVYITARPLSKDQWELSGKEGRIKIKVLIDTQRKGLPVLIEIENDAQQKFSYSLLEYTE